MKSSSFPLRLSIATLILVAATRPTTAQPPEYSVFRLGLTGGVFTTPLGVETSTASAFAGGTVAGYSTITITTTSGGGGPIIIGGGGPIIIGGGPIIIGTGGTATQISMGRGEWLGNVATGVTTRIGLTGPGFTGTDGLQDGSTLGFRDGYAVGQSTTYSGNNSLGTASWIASAATGVTTRIGFFDATYTYPDSRQDSHVQYVQSGYAAGYSLIATGGGGQAAWVANGATGATVRIGFFDAGYTYPDGYQSSEVSGLNGGTVIGQSSRFDGATPTGQAAWMAAAATGVTTRLGFTGANYTKPDGTQVSRVQYVDGGYVMGWSGSYNGVLSSGQTQWVAPVGTGVPLQIGLVSAPYTAADGTRISYADLLSEGHVAGQSYLYAGSSLYNGHAAWVADATTGATRRIGFFDAPYTRNDGFQYSLTSYLNGTYVAGLSRKYSGGTQIGQAVWVAPVASGDAIRLGLFDAGYTRADGTQSSGVSFLKGGYVAGNSSRYIGNASAGQMGWLADAATGATTPLGLTDAIHTATDGSQFTSVTNLTASGYVAGFSNRFSGQFYNGMTPWIYAADSAILTPLVFSIRPSDSFATATITQLYESGLAIGQYELYDSSSADLGARAFAWTPQDGVFELSTVVPGGISAAGWSALATAFLADPVAGTLIGHGLVPANANTQAVYVAVQTPEPGSAALIAFMALGLVARRRRTGGGLASRS